MNKVIKTILIAALTGMSSLIGVAFAEVENESHKALESIPHIVKKTLLIRDSKKSGYQKIDDSSPLVLCAKTASRIWIDSVINKNFLPVGQEKVDFSKRENVDVVNYSWSVDGYTFIVVQTRSIYCMKVIPDQINTRKIHDLEEAKKFAKEITMMVFAESSLECGRQFEDVVVEDLPKIIADYTFNQESLVSWQRGDGRIELLSLPKREANQDRIWYKKVSCYFDGDSFAYFFLKENRGPTKLLYNYSDLDKEWFVEPRKIKLPSHMKLEEPTSSE